MTVLWTIVVFVGLCVLVAWLKPDAGPTDGRAVGANGERQVAWKRIRDVCYWSRKVVDEVLQREDFDWAQSDLGGTPTLNGDGRARIEHRLEKRLSEWGVASLENAARAKWGVEENVHYRVQGKKVSIIDLGTGKVIFDPDVDRETRWNGLVQALETRHNVIVHRPLFEETSVMAQFKKKPKAPDPIDVALTKFDAGLARISVAEPTHRADEIQVLRTPRGGWHGRGVVTGTVDDVRRVLRANLERDLHFSGFADVIVLTFPDDKHVQLQAMPGAGKPVRGSGGAYRVWRTDEGAALYTKAAEVLAAGAEIELLA